jgi:hypothetical protein
VKAKAFLRYFEKTYLGYMKTGMEKSPIFPVKMWNHYDIMMTFQVCLSQILDLYSFKPKTKYVEDLLDTNCF